MSILGKDCIVSIALGVVGNYYVGRPFGSDTLGRLSVAVYTLVSDVPVWYHVVCEVILSLLLAADALVVVSPSNIHVRGGVVDFIVSEGASNELKVAC